MCVDYHLAFYFSSDYVYEIEHADKAQQAFSSEKGPSLHSALPALEALHKAWTTRTNQTEYLDFISPLEAGLMNIEEYYDRTADSDAYTFAMR